jgi:flagellar hook-length control protein FliK
MKKEASEELVAQQMQVNPSVQGSQGIQQAGAAEAVQRPGLNINEIQSIVNRVDLAVNEKGLPEMRFELQTQNLGNIDLKVSAENDQIRIELATDDINAQKVLEENLNELGEKLREKGLNLAETRFSQRGQEDAEKQQQNQQQQEDQDYFPSSTTGRKRTFNL